MRIMGYPDTDLNGKCHECYMYRPLIKVDDRTGIETMFARGKCLYPYKKDTYKQRTDSCKKFLKKGEKE